MRECELLCIGLNDLQGSRRNVGLVLGAGEQKYAARQSARGKELPEISICLGPKISKYSVLRASWYPRLWK